MFRRTIDPHEQQDVLQLLGRWSHAIARIDEATDAMRSVIAIHPLGMQSDEFEQARLTAIEVVDQVRSETSTPRFWPVLADDKGLKIMIEFQQKLDESRAHQLNLLNLYGIAADAFRRGKEDQAPSNNEFMTANKNFGRVLDDMGKIGGKLARHYRISAQELQIGLRC